MTKPRVLLAGPALALLIPGAAQAATLSTDQPCYVEREPMTISGSGWVPGSRWSVQADQIFAAGDADGAGAFSTLEPAPFLSSSGVKPKTFTLTGDQDGTEVASTTFKVVNFLVKPAKANGKPTKTTRWAFSGFLPGRKIYFHVKRGRKVYTEKAGRGDRTCGNLRTRVRRLPAVPASQIKFGTYKVIVDNRRKLRKGGRKYKARITVFRRFT